MLCCFMAFNLHVIITKNIQYFDLIFTGCACLGAWNCLVLSTELHDHICCHLLCGLIPGSTPPFSQRWLPIPMQTLPCTNVGAWPKNATKFSIYTIW